MAAHVFRLLAATLAMALWIFVICGTFGNYSYSFYFPVLAGLVQAFDICVRKETAAAVITPIHPQTRLAPAPAYAGKRQLRAARAWPRPRRSSAG